MARHSIFKKLPKELTELFHSLLDEDKYTHEQIVSLLNNYLSQVGEEQVITRHIVQHTAKNYAERTAKACGEARREALIAEKTIAELGGKPNTDQSKALGMILQTLNMRVGVAMMDNAEALPSTKELRELAQSSKIIDEKNKIIEILEKQADERAAAKILEAAKKDAAAGNCDDTSVLFVKNLIDKANATNQQT